MLKIYQQKSIAALKTFLVKCSEYKEIKQAYAEETRNNLGSEGIYNNAGFANTPYVCLRLPTGGGKTFLASYSIPIICSEYLARDFSLVIWLVPSNAILEQTYKSLISSNHPYRKVLNEYFGGNVEILKAEEGRDLSKGVLQSNTVIIISTFASWRVDRTEGRRVYESSGSLQHHFANLKQEIIDELEHQEIDGTRSLKYSLANIVYLNNPIFIIDEAHNARTELTFEVLKRLNPSCIIEFTATPKTKGADRSNVLYSVSAADLKAEDMIKMPIELLTTSDWQTTLSDAIRKQKELELVALEEETKTGEYIRPIVLIQAQNSSKTESTISVDEVKSTLLDKFKIPIEQIAVATGEERGIEGINLLDRSTPIRFIITKQALKEGWDCPFAYVFCSVAHVNSSKDVEQLLGRVLRMPNIKKKNKAELNKAYAFVSSESFFNTAKNLQDSLIQSGFTAVEASELIEVSPDQYRLGEFFGNITVEVSAVPDISSLSCEISEKIVINLDDKIIILKDELSESDKEAIVSVLKTSKDKEAFEQAYSDFKTVKERSLSPFRQGKVFSVPQLLIDFDGERRIFDEEVLLSSSWSLADCDVSLTEEDFPVKINSSTTGTIDIDNRGNTITYNATQIQEELTSLIVSSTMDKGGLIQWLVKECRHQSIPFAQTVIFVANAVDNLIEIRSLNIEHLVFTKFRLREALRHKINGHYIEAKKKGFQELLFIEPNISKDKLSRFEVGEDLTFTNNYMPYSLYSGKFRFSKHYHDQVGDMNDEEAECAFNLDIHNNVDYWIRNIERQEFDSFWLQTSTDKFYPDFIVKLLDGRTVIVEYKGLNLYGTDDSKEKRQIGEFYEIISRGKCKFIMLKGKDWSRLKAILS